MRTNESRGECSPLAVLAAAILLVLANRSAAAEGPSDVQQAEVFVSRTHGYYTYRIPALVVTAKGTLLAFCEGRKTGRSDTRDIDTLLRRSIDGGKTWSDIRVVSDFGGDGAGNPTVVEDRDTGRIWLFNTWNSIKFPEPRIVGRIRRKLSPRLRDV